MIYTVNWNDIPEKYNFVAWNSNGSIHAYVNKPSVVMIDDEMWYGEGDHIYVGFGDRNPHWSHSLLERTGSPVAIPTHITIDNRRYKLVPIGDEE